MGFTGAGKSLLRLRVLLAAMLAAVSLCAQEQPGTSALPIAPQTDAEAIPATTASAQPAEPPGGNRVFGVLPNYRTADASQEGTVLTAGQKLNIASKDSFDYPLVMTAGALAGVAEVANEDPRYFRRGTGPVASRAFYALTRVMVTHKDSGGSRFNYSEWLGNASAVGISNAYYPDGRTLADNGTKLLMQVGTDAVSQVLKEFWPDIRRKMFHKD